MMCKKHEKNKEITGRALLLYPVLGGRQRRRRERRRSCNSHRHRLSCLLPSCSARRINNDPIQHVRRAKLHIQRRHMRRTRAAKPTSMSYGVESRVLQECSVTLKPTLFIYGGAEIRLDFCSSSNLSRYCPEVPRDEEIRGAGGSIWKIISLLFALLPHILVRPFLILPSPHLSQITVTN